jgi:hypothetical protein
VIGRALWGGAVLLAAVAALPGRAPAQDVGDTLRPAPAVVTPPTGVRPDSAGRVGPFGAMWRSMLLPGWGQAVSERHVTGAMFVAWEGLTAAMTLKARGEVRYFERIESPLLESKRREVQDWLVLWVFNHLFAGAEAFVAAHLRDFPGDLRLRALPRGVSITLPLP